MLLIAFHYVIIITSLISKFVKMVRRKRLNKARKTHSFKAEPFAERLLVIIEQNGYNKSQIINQLLSHLHSELLEREDSLNQARELLALPPQHSLISVINELKFLK